MSVIRKLDETVINRIAAGEVVQRPSAAIKELIENSLDAGSTSITITVKGGGLQLLQIQDNGHGIRKDDLGIVCERFTTSKLSTFEDLKSISTFGFRGEALASITHVAHVTLLTKTQGSPCAYKAKYSDGKPVPLKPGERSEPKPCAGVIGTTISVEDLFYNMQTRKQAFKNLNDEYQRILDVVTKYSIRYGSSGVSFTCKKFGMSAPDLHTPVSAAGADGTLENIRIAYGSQLAKELIPFQFSSNGNGNRTGSNAEKADELCVSAVGKISNANFSHKKATYVFFINNRLVECASIRKTIEAVYSEILPRHTYPFVYLSISMPAQDLDVNVHPTKKEVHFLYEDKLLELLHAELSSALRSSNDSRSFQVQTTLRFDQPSQITSATQHHTSGADGSSALPQRNLSNLTAKLLPVDSSVVASSEHADVTTSARLGGLLLPLPATSASTREAPQNATFRKDFRVADKKGDADEEEDAEFDFSQVHNRHYLAPRASSSSSASSKHAQVSSMVAQRDDAYDMKVDAPDSGAEDDNQEYSDEESQEGEDDKYEMSGDEAEEIIFKPSAILHARSNATAERGFALPKSSTCPARSDPSQAGNSGGGVRPVAAVAPKKMVRTDPSLVKIDAFFKPTASAPPTAPGSSLTFSSGAVEEENCECAEPSLPEPATDTNDDPEAVYCLPAGSSESLRVGSKRPAGAASALPGGFAASCLCCGKTPKRSRLSLEEPPRVFVNCKLDELVETSCEYVSVQALIREIKSNRSAELETMLRNHTHVGAVDCYFSLIQHGTRLMLLDHSHLLKDMYYQIALRRFAELGKWVLEHPVSLAAYLEAALESEHAAGRLDVPHTEVPALTTAAVALLCSKAPLVQEYFNISIDAETATLTALPIMVAGVKPLLHELPTFLLNLATHTNWDDETACFQTVALNLASYYSILDTEDVPVDESTAPRPGPPPFPQLTKESADLLGNVLYPAMRLYLFPHRQRSTDHTVIQVAALEQLYKVFERC